ncbi:MAG: zf-HC2 domain-containing protein [Bryobacteraceae bacterium]
MPKSDCKNVFAMLSEHLDGELPAATCDELEKHIQDCAPCVEFVESLKKSIALGRKYQPGSEPPQLAPDVKRSLQEAYQRMLDQRAANSK